MRSQLLMLTPYSVCEPITRRHFHWLFGCFISVSWQFHGSFMKVSFQFHDSFISVSFQFHGSLISVSFQFHGSFISVSFQFHGSLISVSFQFHGSFMAVSFQFHFSFVAVSFQFHGSFIASIMSAGRAVHHAQMPLVHVHGSGPVAAVGVEPDTHMHACMHAHEHTWPWRRPSDSLTYVTELQQLMHAHRTSSDF